MRTERLANVKFCSFARGWDCAPFVGLLQLNRRRDFPLGGRNRPRARAGAGAQISQSITRSRLLRLHEST